MKNNAQQWLAVGRFELFVKTEVVKALVGISCRVRGICRYVSGKPTILNKRLKFITDCRMAGINE